MMILTILFYYSFVASIILQFGIGSDRLFLNSNTQKLDVHYFINTLIVSIVSAILIWAINTYILMPLHLTFVSPIILALILLSIDSITHTVLKFKNRNPLEKNFEYGIVFFAFFQSFSLKYVILIIITGIFTLLVLSYILSNIKSKINMSEAGFEWKIAPLTLISIGFILLATYSAEISWLKHIFF